MVWGQQCKSPKKLSDLMPINVIFTNSGRISLRDTIILILVFICIISSFKIEFQS